MMAKSTFASAWGSWPVAVAGALTAAFALGAEGPAAQAAAIARSTGAVAPANAITGKNAPSANCAGVQISNFGYDVNGVMWPNPGNGRTTGSGVVSCSDKSVFQGAPIAILSAAQTRAVGGTILKTFPLGYAGLTALQAGEAFLYNRFVNGAGKVPAGTAMASATSPSGSVATATASQSSVFGLIYIGKATAAYARAKNEPLSGLGIGIVNDPFDLSPQSLGTPGSAQVYLGDTTDPADQLMLQASEPGDFAAATYTLGIGSETLLGLTISITSATTSLGSAFQVTDFDGAGLGWTNLASFTSALVSDFSLNIATHTLSETAPFLLDPTPLPIVTDDTILTFNYTSAAGGVVPEPRTVCLVAVGLLAIGLVGRRRVSYAG